MSEINPFTTIFDTPLKQMYTNAMDALLQSNALTVPCRLHYSGASNNSILCDNCLFDPITKLSSNIYNGTGHLPFTEGHICPVCVGLGMLKADKSEILYLAVIFDSKYFMRLSSDYVNVAGGMAQTICLSSYLPKIRNANEIIFDTKLEQYGNYSYERAGDPTPAGFGDNRYIITMWKRK